MDLGFLPKDLWTERLPKKFQERARHVVKKDGGDFWVCDDWLRGDWRGGAWSFRQRDRNIVYALNRAGKGDSG
jgi:hypothetical protein